MYYSDCQQIASSLFDAVQIWNCSWRTDWKPTQKNLVGEKYIIYLERGQSILRTHDHIHLHVFLPYRQQSHRKYTRACSHAQIDRTCTLLVSNVHSAAGPQSKVQTDTSGLDDVRQNIYLMTFHGQFLFRIFLQKAQLRSRTLLLYRVLYISLQMYDTVTAFLLCSLYGLDQCSGVLNILWFLFNSHTLPLLPHPVIIFQSTHRQTIQYSIPASN